MGSNMPKKQKKARVRKKALVIFLIAAMCLGALLGLLLKKTGWPSGVMGFVTAVVITFVGYPFYFKYVLIK
jgi:hypothetical protein